jgi:hypothetical protein
MENKNFLEELAKTLASVAEDIKKAVVEKTNAVDDSKAIIQKEYNNIKIVCKDLSEIGFILEDFADDIDEVVCSIDDCYDETDAFLNSMSDIVIDEEDDDYEDEENEEDDDCEDCCECKE